jgi:hypothetical protein
MGSTTSAATTEPDRDEPDRDERRLAGWARPVRGLLTTVVASVVLLPLSLIQLLMVPLSLARDDSSGVGGPFRTCAPDSVSCSGPHYGFAALGVLAVVACVVVPALLGQQAGQHRSKAVGRGILAGVSVGILVTATATVLLTHH